MQNVYEVPEEELSPVLEALELEGETLAQLASTIDSLIGEAAFEEPVPTPKGRIKSCYLCPGCKIKVWGKPELNLTCTDCNKALNEQ